MMSARVRTRFALMLDTPYWDETGIGTGPTDGRSEAVRLREQLDRVHLPGRCRGRLVAAAGALQPLDALHDVHPGERAFRRDERIAVLRGLARHRLADLQRGLEILLHETPGT